MNELIQFCSKEDRWKKVCLPLKKLNDMIGMTSIKRAVVRQVRYLITMLNRGMNQTQITRSRDHNNYNIPNVEKRRRLSISKSQAGHKHRAKAPISEDTDDEQSDSSDDDRSNDEDDEDEHLLLKLFSGSKKKRKKQQITPRTIQDLTDIEIDVEFNRLMLGDHLMHVLLMGPPGVGKTTVAELLYNIWVELGLVLPKKFFLVTKADLVAGYLGRSQQKTRQLIETAQHGVICIDECYELISSNDGSDQYGREVLTEIINAMTDPLNKAVFMFCGYKNKIETQLFTANQGLERRFGYIFNIEKPNADELFSIFEYQLSRKQPKWKIRKNDREQALMFFRLNKELFLQHCGGATEKLCRLCQEECVLAQFPKMVSRLITIEHLKSSISTFLEQARTKNGTSVPQGLYT